MSELRRTKRVAANISFSVLKKYEPTELPTEGDDISVHWDLDGKFIWWKAVVTSSFQHHNFPVIGKGTIRYESYGKYEQEISDVEFIFQLNGGKMIRCIGSEHLNSWVFADETILLDEVYPLGSYTESIFPQISNSVEKETKILASNVDLVCVAEGTNDSNTEYTQHMEENKNTSSRSFVPSHTDELEMEDSIEDSRKDPLLHPAISDSKSQEIAVGSSIHQFHESFYKELSKMVVHELRWNLLKKLQTTFNNKCLPMTYYPKQHEISVKTSCSLHSFIAIANTIHRELVTKRQKPYSEQVKFLPSLRSLRSGSMASVSSEILLTSLEDLSFLLGIKEEDDYENLLCRESTVSSKNTTSIIGTIEKDEINGKKFERIIIGQAGTTEHIPEMDVSGSDINCTPCVILEHELDDDAWDETQECFMTPWSSYQSRFRSCFPSDGSNPDERKGTFFNISWSRNTPPSKRRWTADAIHVGSDILGTSTLTVPLVIIEGHRTTENIKHLMDVSIEKIMEHREQRFSN